MASVLLSQQTKSTRSPSERNALPEAVGLHDILVLQLTENSPFIQQMLQFLCALLRHSLYHDLQVLLLQQQDLGIAAFPNKGDVLCIELHKNYNRKTISFITLKKQLAQLHKSTPFSIIPHQFGKTSQASMKNR